MSDWVSDEHRIFQEYENDQNNIQFQLNDYENQSYKLFLRWRLYNQFSQKIIFVYLQSYKAVVIH